jgi:hypothetical protein
MTISSARRTVLDGTAVKLPAVPAEVDRMCFARVMQPVSTISVAW